MIERHGPYTICSLAEYEAEKKRLEEQKRLDDLATKALRKSLPRNKK